MQNSYPASASSLQVRETPKQPRIPNIPLHIPDEADLTTEYQSIYSSLPQREIQAPRPSENLELFLSGIGSGMASNSAYNAGNETAFDSVYHTSYPAELSVFDSEQLDSGESGPQETDLTSDSLTMMRMHVQPQSQMSQWLQQDSLHDVFAPVAAPSYQSSFGQTDEIRPTGTGISLKDQSTQDDEPVKCEYCMRIFAGQYVTLLYPHLLRMNLTDR